uniref:Uncharacterized protein n=1 Tax=Sphaerodactylus townsendi TaxID=933632 RepID=A0ACB8F839_9SAUR
MYVPTSSLQVNHGPLTGALACVGRGPPRQSIHNSDLVNINPKYAGHIFPPFLPLLLFFKHKDVRENSVNKATPLFCDTHSTIKHFQLSDKVVCNLQFTSSNDGASLEILLVTR